MADCNHNCGSCSEECGERDPKSLLIEPNKHSKFKKIIGVISGKGGVGKSLVTSLLAVAKARDGAKVAIMDADVTGPSIPKCFGLKEGLSSTGEEIIPATTKLGIKIVSANLLLENESDPIIWRGPMIGSLVKQFYADVNYGECDYLFIDMPPGTGDVALTIFQSIKIDGIIIVTTPQDLVSMIVTKAIKMAESMNIQILGIVENMSYISCPDCGKRIEVFGKSRLDLIAKDFNLKILGRLPIDLSLAERCDAGKIEEVTNTNIDTSSL